MRRKNTVIALSVVLIAVLAIGATLAFFTDTEEKTNVFTMGDLDITLEEPGWDPGDGDELEPGDVREKDPTITAVENDSYMRVVVSLVDTDSQQVITNASRIALILDTLYYDKNENQIELTGKYSLADLAAMTAVYNPFNTVDFELASSVGGVLTYHYKGTGDYKFVEGTVVKGFTHVVIPTDWDQDDLETLGNYEVVIRAEAIQYKGFADKDEAFTALDAELQP